MRTALVTGGARGIGAAIVSTLAAAGWRVIAADIDADAVAQAAREWIDAPITGAVLDVTDRTAVVALMDAHGPLDVVVNNAAIPADMLPFAELTPEHFARALRINVQGSFIVAQEAARRMDSGAIVNIASRGYLGGIGGAHYVASKAAVVGITRAMAVELRWRGISVNAVAPGMVETRMIEGFSPAMRNKLTEMEPGGGPLDPSVIAGAVAYLASPAGRSVTGQVLLVDGGKTIGTRLY
ncbi:3-oxoacyl-[acyl-carrier protein] reductase [Sphingomonas sp. PP-CE-1A-559]|uniref:SDR family NAD(P)-dependent oxidoreductase n=1 Tax=Sphingomonas sp. PP-CE-1A-559 TaxID=2135657 RepID=UPI001055AF8E|nr:SDR family oxidoreductase [Sphingomonas sp. PP-CE-1A-559]TCP86024.1 3-oxoacyl-[acyl-carrier protein] reductase [Sphingomonas sp. PP-CE-1A-559]